MKKLSTKINKSRTRGMKIACTNKRGYGFEDWSYNKQEFNIPSDMDFNNKSGVIAIVRGELQHTVRPKSSVRESLTYSARV